MRATHSRRVDDETKAELFQRNLVAALVAPLRLSGLPNLLGIRLGPSLEERHDVRIGVEGWGCLALRWRPLVLRRFAFLFHDDLPTQSKPRPAPTRNTAPAKATIDSLNPIVVVPTN